MNVNAHLFPSISQMIHRQHQHQSFDMQTFPSNSQMIPPPHQSFQNMQTFPSNSQIIPPPLRSFQHMQTFPFPSNSQIIPPPLQSFQNMQTFPSNFQMIPSSHQSFHNMQTFLPHPSPPINPPPFKRQRTLQTPIDHKTVASLKKLERQTIKEMKPCSTHRIGMIEMPYQILKCVQAQGIKLSTATENIDYLCEQVNSLHDMVKIALAALRSSKQSAKDTTVSKTPHPLLPTYHTLITQTIETLKTNPPPPNGLQSTSESINKLHQLILLQCDFDSLGGPPNESGSKSSSMALDLPTVESVLKTLQEMEQNLKTYINLQRTTKKNGNGSRNLTQPKMSRATKETSRAPIPSIQQPPFASPVATSTPIKPSHHRQKSSQLNPSSQKRKGQEDDNYADNYQINSSFGNISAIPHSTNTRKMLNATKTYSFSYVKDSMDVD